MTRNSRIFGVLAAAISIAAAHPADAQLTTVRVRVTNRAPANGTALTPVWVGLHDGTFRTFTPGMPSSAALERLAEDGPTSPISALFNNSGFSAQATLGSAPLLSGQSAEYTFLLDPNDPKNRYLNYASMVLPSNDAFIGNANPLAFALLGSNGQFRSFSFNVLGSNVWDAGTEINDEGASSTAFFGQSMPNTGMTENGVVTQHPGFISGGRILSSSQFANADFTQDGYQVAQFEIAVVPEPSTYLLMGTGLLGLWVVSARRKRANHA